jgi:hypothetical protein
MYLSTRGGGGVIVNTCHSLITRALRVAPVAALVLAAWVPVAQGQSTNFNNTGGFQTWTVPATGLYNITAFGAQGGFGDVGGGGLGAEIGGEFSLSSGQVLTIAVGGAGTGGGFGGGGGGGSFVVSIASGTTNALVIAGGGGGGSDFNFPGGGGIVGSGGSGYGGVGGAAGTIGGAGGGGFLGNGGPGGYFGGGGFGFPAGLAGGTNISEFNGGFGGGGGSGGYTQDTGGGGGGGGGYTGGNGGSGALGGDNISSSGGGSYNAGSNPIGVAGYQSGNGLVEIVRVLPVLNANDSGAGSLREAVMNANASTIPAIITFTNTLAGQTITLTSGQLTLSNTVAIDASALSNGVAVSGNNSSRVFEVAAGAVVNLSALNIQNGYAPNGNSPTNYGGGILNRGALALTNCTLTANQAQQGSNPDGGGIENFSVAATLTLQNCLVSSNHSDHPGAGGGGIDINNGVASINQCTFTANSCTGGHGGGIFVEAGSATINQCTVSGNSATTGGGVALSGSHTISNSVVANNVASSGSNIAGSFTGANNLTSGTPLLAPPGNYGGPTQTMPPLPGSPAIDGCTNGTSFTTDQRGFPRIVGPYADIGAVEVQSPAASPPVLGNITVPAGGSANGLQFTFTNAPAADFTVLTATNVALPLTNWTVLGEVLQPAPGQYQFTDPQAATNPARFYSVRSP